MIPVQAVNQSSIEERFVGVEAKVNRYFDECHISYHVQKKIITQQCKEMLIESIKDSLQGVDLQEKGRSIQTAAKVDKILIKLEENRETMLKEMAVIKEAIGSLKTDFDKLQREHYKLQKDVEMVQEEQINSSQVVNIQEFEDLNERVAELEQERRVTTSNGGLKIKRNKTDLSQITDDKSESDAMEDAGSHDTSPQSSDSPVKVTKVKRLTSMFSK